MGYPVWTSHVEWRDLVFTIGIDKGNPVLTMRMEQRTPFLNIRLQKYNLDLTIHLQWRSYSWLCIQSREACSWILKWSRQICYWHYKKKNGAQGWLCVPEAQTYLSYPCEIARSSFSIHTEYTSSLLLLETEQRDDVLTIYMAWWSKNLWSTTQIIEGGLILGCSWRKDMHILGNSYGLARSSIEHSYWIENWVFKCS